MYKIIGADGLAYGPVSAEQIRRWISEGRVHAQTPAQADGAAEWKTLAAFPEFESVLADKASSSPGTAPGGAPSGPPPPNASEGARLANGILAREYPVEVWRCLERAWNFFLSDFWTLLGINAVIWLLVWFSHGTAAGLILTGPLLAGLYWYCLKRIRGRRAVFEDAFSGFTIDFVQTMLAGLVTSVLIGVGLALCVAPGIYLLVAWAFALPLVMDQRLPFWDAMEVSRKVITRRWWSFFGLLLLSLLMNLAGALLCCVGMFVTLPITTLAWLYAYEDIFGALPSKTA